MQATGPGRPRAIVRIDEAVHASIVVEILADRVRIGAWTLSSVRLEERELALNVARHEPRETLARVAAICGELLRALHEHRRRIVGVLVALPGLLDVRSGTLLTSVPLGWHDVAVQRLLQDDPALAGHPVTLGRIANLATIAEWRRDPVRHDLLCLHGTDTGLSTGIVARGSLLTGSHGRAGELLFAAPTARSAFGNLDELLRRARTSPSTVDNLVARLDAGQRSAHTALDVLATGIADRLATLIALLDPESVVLAGYLAQLGEHLRTPVRRELAAHLAFRPEVPITLGQLGAEATQVGGATLLADAAFDLTRSRRIPQRQRPGRSVAAMPEPSIL